MKNVNYSLYRNTKTVISIEKYFYKHNQEHFLFLFQKNNFSAIQRVVLVSQRLVLLLLEESSLCLPLRRGEWGFLLNLLTPSRQTLLVKTEYQCPVYNQRLHPLDRFPITIEHCPDQQTPDTRFCPSLVVHLHLEILRHSCHVFLAAWG